MKIFYLGVFLIFSGCIFGQQCDYTVSGKVRDFHDGTPLVGATLAVVNSERYALTDLEGNFKIDKLCAGTYILKITHSECNPSSFTLDITGDLKRDFKLEHHTEELREVTVTGEKFSNETKTAAESSLKKATLEAYSNSSLGDALKEIAGVSSLNTGSTVVKPIIQGLHSSRVLIITNGTRLEDQEWGVEHAPNLDINNAANITVIKGASALRYGGDAVGGVIVADAPKAPVKDTLYGRTLINGSTNGRGGGITSNLMKAYQSGFYLQGQGTFKYAGDLEAPDYVLSNTGIREKDFSVGFGLNKFNYGFDAFYSYYDAEIGILRASHIGNVSDLVRAINSPEPRFVADFSYEINAPKQDVKHHLAKISFFKRFENAGKLNLDYSFQLNNRKEFDVRRGADRNMASLDLELSTHTINSNFKWDSKPNFTANFGTELAYQINVPNPETGIRRLIPDYEMYTAGAYATLDYTINPQWILEGGIRYDFMQIDAEKFYQRSRWEERGYQADFGNLIIREFPNQLLTNPVFGYHNFSGTVGARYDIDTRFNLKANLSTASRSPNPAELFSDGLHHSAAIIELGDLRLSPEQSYKASLSFEGAGEGFSFIINPFINRINDFIILEPSGLQFTNRGAFPVYEYSQVDSRLFGIDIQGSYTFNEGFDLTSVFAYVNGEDLDRKRPLIGMPAPNWTNTISYTKQTWNNFSLSVRSQAVFEQTRFPDNNFVVDFINDSGQQVSEEVRISETPEAYHLIHLASSVDLNLFAKSPIKLSFFVDNIFNTAFRDYLNRQRFFVDDMGRNFRIQLKLNY